MTGISSQKSTSLRVVVIGAGMVGTTIAARLAQRGAHVNLIEQKSPGSGTSSTTYAWINANGKEPENYFALNKAGMDAHYELAGESAPWLQKNGHVEIAVSDEERKRLRTRVKRLTSWGYAAEEVSRANAVGLLPDVQIPDDVQAIAFYEQEAHVYTSLYIAHMMAVAQGSGVKLHLGAQVVDLCAAGDGGNVILDNGSTFAADVVVSAVGRWSSQLANLAGARVPMVEYSIPGDVTVGYLLQTEPVPVRLNRLLTTSLLNVRPDGGGRLLLQALDLDATAEPNHSPSVESELAYGYLERLQSLIPGTKGVKASRLVVGRRAMPADGRTIVGPLPEVPWLYTVATHSGVTLAPFLGDRVAAEVFGETEALFDDFRPDRFDERERVVSPAAPRRPGEQ